MRLRGTTAILLGLIIASPQSIAQGIVCDPKDHLVKDFVSLDEDLETNLSLLDETAQSQSKSAKSGITAKIAGQSLSGDDARSASASIKKILNLNYTENQKRTLFLSALSPLGLAAYVKCLETNKSHLSVTISEGALKRRHVLVTVRWHPFYPAPSAAKAGALVSGGKIAEVLYERRNFASLGEVDVKPQTTLTFKVERESIFEPTEIAGDIEGHHFRIDIPSAPKLRLVTEVREGSPIKFGPTRETCSKPSLSSCVTLKSSDEGVLLPGTFQWKTPNVELLAARTIVDVKTDSDSLRICRSFTLSCEAVKNYAHIDKTGTALLVKAVQAKE